MNVHFTLTITAIRTRRTCIVLSTMCSHIPFIWLFIILNISLSSFVCVSKCRNGQV